MVMMCMLLVRCVVISSTTGFKLYVSDSGEQVLMLTSNVEFYLWEVGPHAPQWWKLFPPRAVLLPLASYRETAMDAGFYVHQVHMHAE